MVRAFAHGAMGRRIDPSWGGSIDLVLFPRLVSRGMCYPVWDVHIKEPLLLIGKSSPYGGSGYLNGPLLYVRRHITVNKMC